MKKKTTEYLSGKEVAALLELPEVTIERWIKQGKIPSKSDHNKIVLVRDEIVSWAKTHDLAIKKKLANGSILENKFALNKAIKLAGIYNNIKGNDTYSVFENALEKLSFINIKFKKSILEELINREEMASTGIGNGIAIPHTRKRMALEIGTAHVPVIFLKEPIFFNAVDNNPVTVLFILFTTNLKEHLKILSKLSYMLRKESIMQILKNENSANNLLKEIELIENEQNQ